MPPQPFGALRVGMVVTRHGRHNVEEFIAQFWQACLIWFVGRHRGNSRRGNSMRAEGIETIRRILCVFPRYTSSFGTFEYSYPLTDGVQAFMPPQGLLLIAAYLPANWSVRFIDENIRAATAEDFKWAEAVFVSGMHIQRQQMNDICRRAPAFDLGV